MKTLYKVFNLLILSGMFTFSPVQAHAAPLINELHPNPTSGSEWVELYNPDSTPAQLASWYLEDELSSPAIIFTFTNESIEPGEYLVVPVSSKLNNSADGIKLKNPSGSVVDSTSYTSSQAGLSWARVPDGSGPLHLQTPTQGQPNLEAVPSPSPSSSPQHTPSPTPHSSATPQPSPSSTPLPSLLPSEIVACPVSPDTEWLEVFNPAGSALNVTNWKIRDASNTTRMVSAIIPSNGLAVLSWTGSLLNNSGDTLSLETPDGQKLFEVSFDECVTGRSFILHQSNWQETTTVTKGSTNLFTDPQGTSTSDLASQTASEAATLTNTNTSTTPHFVQSTELTTPLPPLDQQPQPSIALPDVSHFILGSGTQPAPSGTVASTDHLTLHARQPRLSLVISGILGGLVLSLVGSYYLYVFFEKQSLAELAQRISASPAVGSDDLSFLSPTKSAGT
jgi:hypothetical protein